MHCICVPCRALASHPILSESSLGGSRQLSAEQASGVETNGSRTNRQIGRCPAVPDDLSTIPPLFCLSVLRYFLILVALLLYSTAWID